MRKTSGLELRKCTALLAISILIIITAAGSPGVHVFHLRAGEMQSTYCNSEMHIENVQKILVLATMLLLLHLTARRRKTKRSPAETRGHCCRRRRRLKWIQLKIWQRLHFDFPSRILSSNAFIIYQPATGSKHKWQRRTETANCKLQLNSADSCCSCQRRRYTCPRLLHVAYLLVLTVRQQQQHHMLQLRTQTPTVALVE